MGITKLSNYDNIYASNKFSKEWVNLFKKRPKDKKKADNWLDNNLALLDNDAFFQTNYNPNHFEPVVGSNPKIYSIHEKNRFQSRVLYYLLTESNEVVLLTAFIEKDKSDYREATNRATNRAEQILQRGSFQ